MGLVVSPHLYNEMMKLYTATAQFGKVPLVIKQMRSNKIPLTGLSYNLCMNACAELSGVASVEMVYREMVSDENVQLAVRNAEEKLSNRSRLGYFFLIALWNGSQFAFRYDVRVSSVLLGAYMRNGMVEKAESLHQHTLDRGGCPNYKTWEILMEGRLKNQNMDEAVEAMKQGFAMLQDCHWRPSDDTVMAFADYLKGKENLRMQIGIYE
ncbi:putative pentatricopeptide [Rosa chinensis]|uniref:Putative pentatricopeptide n=1 Tax=Rosa chinensis TaxID=74649 RepID=A0A2P6SAM7_ROSCH|nr:putative pentatricopeptide [Rosa chinensis]